MCTMSQGTPCLMVFMSLWSGLWVWQHFLHPCQLSICCGCLAPPISSVKSVNWTRSCAYNVPSYPPPPPLFNDIQDSVVRIMGVTALTTTQTLLCKTGNLHPHLTTSQLNTILTPLPHPNTPNTTLTRALCSSC